MTQLQSGRRYDIDTLRTLAFMLLIFYHIGMYYVADWGWHVKSVDTYVWLQDIMLLVNQWRMCLLFILSGMAMALIKGKYSGGSLLWLRSKRLLIPLIFAMYVIVAPQLFYQLQFNEGYQQSYWEFWLQYINAPADFFANHQSSIGLLTWNHLWYLPYLWMYTCIMLVIGGALATFSRWRGLQHVRLWQLMFVLVVIQTINWMTLGLRYPDTHDLINDWYVHTKYLLAFSVGYMLVFHQHWWQRCVDCRKPLLAVALCCYGFILFDHHGFMPSKEEFAFPALVQSLYAAVYFINRYAWLFTVIGFGSYYLNKPSPFLRYANEAILPWYIFHQTLIIVLAMWLRDLQLVDSVEFLLLTVGTLLGCGIGYELVRRFWITRLLFGLKIRLPMLLSPKPVVGEQ
ncbi:acyltransferase family protein [Alteromonadaceae bacterium BrNp21-10]|nr:acyltransferase family protein [Alteromonadaceae bacterium BrNp21-10]